MTATPIAATDRIQRLRDDANDAARAVVRLTRLLHRQAVRRNRLNRTIAHTRRRLVSAAALATETARALTAAGGAE